MPLQLHRAHWVVVPLLAIICAGGLSLHKRWVVESPPRTRLLAAIEINADGARTTVLYPGYVFIARVATFRDELFAYLMFEHYRKSQPFRQERLLLSFSGKQDSPQYRVDLILSSDYMAAVERVAHLHAARTLETSQVSLIDSGLMDNYRRHTRLFEAAYSKPVQRKLENLPAHELRKLMRRFIRYKSTTDPRIRKRIEPMPKALAADEAQSLAGDIIDVAKFYKLPLDLFLGIGAMENNYMDVRGDLKNSIWKKRAAKDDIVLDRRKGRVRVLNDSAGRWQITRETLRYVHQLYLKDTRDYNLLAPHLRPSKDLDLNNIDPMSLTTYAGLLLRELLDHFKGNTELAVGAYNGGPGNPNMRYEGGVRAAAAHARSILERAAALNGESVMHMRWLNSH